MIGVEPNDLTTADATNQPVTCHSVVIIMAHELPLA